MVKPTTPNTILDTLMQALPPGYARIVSQVKPRGDRAIDKCVIEDCKILRDTVERNRLNKHRELNKYENLSVHDISRYVRARSFRYLQGLSDTLLDYPCPLEISDPSRIVLKYEKKDKQITVRFFRRMPDGTLLNSMDITTVIF